MYAITMCLSVRNFVCRLVHMKPNSSQTETKWGGRTKQICLRKFFPSAGMQERGYFNKATLTTVR